MLIAAIVLGALLADLLLMALVGTAMRRVCAGRAADLREIGAAAAAVGEPAALSAPSVPDNAPAGWRGRSPQPSALGALR